MKIEQIKQASIQNIQKTSKVHQKPAIQRDVTSFGGNVASKEASQNMSNNFKASQKMKQDKEVAFKGRWVETDYKGSLKENISNVKSWGHPTGSYVYIDDNNNVYSGEAAKIAEKRDAAEVAEKEAARQRSWDSFVNNVKDEAKNEKINTLDSYNITYGDGKTVKADEGFLVALGHKVEKVKSMPAEQKKKFLAMEAEKLGDDFLKVVNENIHKAKNL